MATRCRTSCDTVSCPANKFSSRRLSISQLRIFFCFRTVKLSAFRFLQMMSKITGWFCLLFTVWLLNGSVAKTKRCLGSWWLVFRNFVRQGFTKNRWQLAELHQFSWTKSKNAFFGLFVLMSPLCINQAQMSQRITLKHHSGFRFYRFWRLF